MLGAATHAEGEVQSQRGAGSGGFRRNRLPEALGSLVCTGMALALAFAFPFAWHGIVTYHIVLYAFQICSICSFTRAWTHSCRQISRYGTPLLPGNLYTLHPIPRVLLNNSASPGVGGGRTRISQREKMKFTKGNIDLGYFWNTNFWTFVFQTPPPPTVSKALPIPRPRISDDAHFSLLSALWRRRVSDISATEANHPVATAGVMSLDHPVRYAGADARLLAVPVDHSHPSQPISLGAGLRGLGTHPPTHPPKGSSVSSGGSSMEGPPLAHPIIPWSTL